MEIKGVTPDQVENQISATVPEGTRKRSRRRNITVFVLVTLLNVGLLALLWTQLMTPRATSTKPQLVNDPSITGFIASPLVGQQAPDFKLAMLNDGKNGQQFHLADLKGQPLIINFWSSSCAPCQDEAPFLQRSSSSLQAKGVRLIGIDVFERSSSAQNFLQKYGVTYTNVQDNLEGATGISYGVTGNPETYFIDKNGVVVGRWIGALNEAGLTSALAKMHVG